jgi:uncharacterized SAM-binding protein YcdF (DUF218 family)
VTPPCASPRAFRRCAFAAIAALVVWFAGLGWFVASSLAIRGDTTTPTDAIVVLTGGRLRLEAGLALLAAGKGRRLFISGVNPRVDRAALLRALGTTAEREACCIVLGRRSDDTAGNAGETAGWMRRQGFNSLRLVTSWYHMRRAVLEFRRAMPRLAIVPQPVFAPHVDPEGWWGWHGAALLVLGEYHKYLAAWLRSALIDRFRPPTGAAPITPATAAPRGIAALRP